MFSDCMTAITTKDTKLAAQIIDRDNSVNALEVAIDEQCIELLARYQPAAVDLRFITRGLKIVTDLERVGDLAVNIASRIIEILKIGTAPLDISDMMKKVQTMLIESLESFVNLDVQKAQKVLQDDDIVDDLTEKYVTALLDRAPKEPQNIKVIFPMTSIIRYLERVSDHSTNIAELAIFTAKGRDVRHSKPL
jgi:phosphate transport system protein